MEKNKIQILTEPNPPSWVPVARLIKPAIISSRSQSRSTAMAKSALSQLAYLVRIFIWIVVIPSWKDTQYLDQGNYVQAEVVDKCEGCGPTDIDLSPAAFTVLAPEDKGRIQVTWNYL